MLHAHSQNGQASSQHLTEVLHQMLLRSRGDKIKRFGINNRSLNSYKTANTRPNGDPPEVTLWGDD
jgi:hypothetical protein